MKTIGEIKAKAKELWDAGYRLDKKTRRPVSFPMTPDAIQHASGFERVAALQVLHCLNVWSLGVVPVGQFDRI